MKSLLFWLVFPLLLPQALFVRRTAPRHPPAGGPAEGSVGTGESVRLLAIGDSIVAGVGASTLATALVGQTAAAIAEARSSAVAWQAIGVSGYDSAKIIDRLLPKLPSTQADYTVLSVGVNDVTGLTTLPTWRSNLGRILVALQNHSPEAVIAIAGIPPLGEFPLLPQPLRAAFGLRARQFDSAARELAAGYPGVVYVPVDFEPDPHKFAPDGYHPSEEGYTEFGREVASGLLAAGNPATGG